MKKYLIIIILHFSIFSLSCKEKQQITEKVEKLEPNVNFNDLKTDFQKWWTYHSYNISLSSNFIGLNEKFDTIDKKYFLEELTSGNFIPLKLKSKGGINQYKLYTLDSLSKESIRSAIRNNSLTNLKHYKMEGMNFPEFDFTDLIGKHYTNESTKGKTLVIKTWFINCQACVAEFPELNELVKNYKDSKDIIFVSLALDSKDELEKFLKKKIFKYEVVPNQRKFIAEKLNLQAYPTHILLNKNGTILKVVNRASEMISFLENDLEKLSKNIPTPPPM